MELTDIEDDDTPANQVELKKLNDMAYEAGYRSFGDGHPGFVADGSEVTESIRNWMDGWSDAFMDSIEENKHHEFDESVTI